MGFIDTAPGSNPPVFYNVVHAVGKYAPNLRDDVKLVQYLLLAFYDKAQSAGYSRPSGEMAVTGNCLSVTMHWILQYQKDFLDHHPGLRMTTDNRVDRIRNKTFTSSYSKTIYTLAALNVDVINHNPAAYVALPKLIHLDNAGTVPGPTPDMIGAPVSTTGGV